MHDVTFEWGERGVEALSPEADVLVVVDVLSFSTSVSVAVERGASVLPYRFDYPSAKTQAERDGLTLAVHRNDVSERHPYSLSPASLQRLPRGTKLLLPSPNGATCCFRALECGAKNVLVGSLRNARATARAAERMGKRIAVIAAGERWPDGSLRPALEDLLGAGAILSYLRSDDKSPEAQSSLAAFANADGRLTEMLLSCTSGKELVDRGDARDAEIAAQLSQCGTTAVLRDGFIGGG
jgi:2-phosphosulfolactate phosphatase